MGNEKVMGWTSNVQEPKRLNRFELLLSDELRLTCNTVSIPTISVGEVAIDRMHEKYYVAGSKVEYTEVKLTFYDFVDNKAARALQAWYTSVYDIGTYKMGYPKDYKRDLSLIVYGPDHAIIETWLFVGAFPKSFDRPGMDWKDGTGVRNISVSLRIDQAKLTLS